MRWRWGPLNADNILFLNAANSYMVVIAWCEKTCKCTILLIKKQGKALYSLKINRKCFSFDGFISVQKGLHGIFFLQETLFHVHLQRHLRVPFTRAAAVEATGFSESCACNSCSLLLLSHWGTDIRLVLYQHSLEGPFLQPQASQEETTGGAEGTGSDVKAFILVLRRQWNAPLLVGF